MATTRRRRSRSPPSNRRRSCSPPATASFPYFPPELIPEVAWRLTSLQDFFALRAYRAVLPLAPSNLASQAPLLLLSPIGVFSNVLLSVDLVVTWGYLGRTIQFCRLGADDWRVPSISEPYLLQKLICVSGTLYALVTPGSALGNPVYRLAVVELSDHSDLAGLVFIGGGLDARTLHQPDGTELYLYPAECHGELILINAVEFDPRAYHVFQWKSGG